MYLKSMLEFRAVGEQKRKISFHTGDQNLNGFSWNDRRLVLIISVSSVPIPSIVDIEQISMARILADYDLNE